MLRDQSESHERSPAIASRKRPFERRSNSNGNHRRWPYPHEPAFVFWGPSGAPRLDCSAMDHADHTNLLRAGIADAGPVWADLGAGRGAFTLALADLLGATGEIHAVDQDADALRENARTMFARFPKLSVTYQTKDFTRPLELPLLDGIVMANSLHFQKGQATVVRLLREYLRPSGRFLIVEYNIDRGNFAVPHPVPYPNWRKLARDAGFEHTELIARRPSRFLREIYSAVSW